MDLYIDKSKETEVKELQYLFFSIAKLCYNLYLFASNQLALWGKIDNNIIAYIQCIVSENFCDYIKKLRAFKLREKISKGTEEELEIAKSELKELDFNIPISEEYWSNDDILPEDFLINWQRDIDDFEVTQEVREEPKEGNLKIFRSACELTIKKLYDPLIKGPHITELLENISESRIFRDELYDLDKNTTSVRTVYRKNIDEILKFSFLKSKPNIYKRQIIYVSPANERDAWIPNLDTRLRNTYYDRLFYRIFKNHPSFMMVDSQEFDKKISKFINHDGFYVMVDQKKEGLNLPHFLIKILCEELDKVYDFNFSYIYECISNQRIYYKNSWKKTKRGRGLGMINFMSCALHCILGDIIPYDGIMFIDDVVYKLPVSINSLETAKLCLRNISNFYEYLGILISKKKSIISKSFVFLEEYYKTDFYGIESDKFLRSMLAILNSFFCDSFAEFKKRVYNYALSVNINPIFWTTIKKLLKNFRSEFEGEPYMADWEIEMPPYLGGFGLCNVDENFDNELNILGSYNSETCRKICRIFNQQKRMNDSILLREHKSIKIDGELIFEFKYSLKEGCSNFDKNLFRFFDEKLLLTQIEEKLNIVSKTNNRNSRRIRQRILQINKRRKNILLSYDESDYKPVIDLAFDIIKYNDNEGIRNFSIPKFLIKYERDYASSYIPGQIERDLPIIFNREDRILSYLWNKGSLNKKPDITIVTELSDYFDNKELELSYSYKNKVISRYDCFLKDNMEVFPFILTLNVNPEFALMDYILKNSYCPEKFNFSYNEEEWKLYKESYLTNLDEYSDYTLDGKRVSIEKTNFQLWNKVRKKLPRLDRAYYFSYMISKPDLLQNRPAMISFINKLIEHYYFEAYDTKLYNEENGQEIDDLFDLKHLIVFNTENEDFGNEFLDLSDEIEYIPIEDLPYGHIPLRPAETSTNVEEDYYNYQDLDLENFDYSGLINDDDYIPEDIEDDDPFSIFD
jgi:hypothetical protein